MKLRNENRVTLCALVTLGTAAGQLGCEAPPVSASGDTVGVMSGLVETRVEPPGLHCANGGLAVMRGGDRNHNDTLDSNEVNSVEFICVGRPDPANATLLLSTVMEPAGANCAAGGQLVRWGYDRDRDNELDADEVAGKAYVCNGLAGPAGANGTNGADGTNGLDGKSALVTTTLEPPGATCAAGGYVLRSGQDLDGNGALDVSEVLTTAFVCQGEQGPAGPTGPPGPAGPQGPAGPVDPCVGVETLRCAGNRLIGTAVDMGALASEPLYAGVLGREFNYVTAENVMKWGPLEPTLGSWSFGQADAFVAAAEAAGQAIKGHALVWHQQAPSWAAGLAPADLLAAVHDHITTTVSRYRGRIRAWDVINEAITDGTPQIRPGIHTTLGISGMADAFRWAREADPDALLIYNDYGIESPGPKTDAVYGLVQSLLAAGAPVGAVGLQGHLLTQSYPSDAGLRATIQRFAALGLKVNISELDVRTVQVLPNDWAARTQAQRIAYQLVAGVCATEPACESVTTWGFTDAHSWIDAAFGADDPLPYDELYQPKPAYFGLQRGLAGILPAASASLFTNGDCQAGVSGWSPFGSGMLVSVPDGHSGTACGLTGRTATFNGPSQSVTGKVKSGDTLSAVAWVRIAGASSAPVQMTLKISATGVSDVFQRLSLVTASNTGWTLMGGTSALGFAQPPTSLTVYFEGAPAGVDIQVDDVSVRLLAGP